MKNTARSQSTLEFIMIIILVLAGVIVMGPYVIRSVNAYMRSWEISASQSKQDLSVRIQPWELPGGPPPPTLTCGDYDNSSSDCTANNGSLDCTWVKEWFSNGDPNEPCSAVTHCAETENLTAGEDCQPGWNPGEECCKSAPGCPQCPH